MERKQLRKQRGKVWRTSGLLDLRYRFLFHWGDENHVLVGVLSLRSLLFREAGRIILTVILLEEKLPYV